jgi:D-arabinose 1-dehydrogenase-like Zn-dependent alcohol dehydrogenase
VDGVVVVAEREKASVQLCAPEPDAGPRARTLPAASPGRCEEDELYRCASGAVVACTEGAVVGVCVHGCFAEGASVDREIDMSREAAFAILCSR